MLAKHYLSRMKVQSRLSAEKLHPEIE